MAFYYVKSGGTATGDGGRYGTQQTGTFAGLGGTGYYDSIAGAFGATTAPAAGDSIFVSDSHAFTAAASQTYSGSTSGVNINIVCVEDGDIEVSSTGGSEDVSSSATADININGRFFIHGLSIKAGDDISLGADSQVICNECDFILDGSFDRLRVAAAGCYLCMNNSTLTFNNAQCAILCTAGNRFDWFGGSLNGSGTVDNLFDASISMMSNIQGVDLSKLTGTLSRNAGGSSTSDDSIIINLDGCRVAAGLALNNETFQKNYQRITLTRSSDSSSAAEYQYEVSAKQGTIEDATNIFRDESEPYTDSNTKVSYRVDTDGTFCSKFDPLYFDMTVRWSALSAASTDTLRLYLASTTALTDTDVWVDVIYPDGVNKQTFNLAHSRNADILASGTALTTDSSSTWKDGASDLTGHNEYQIDIDTSGDPGADSVPIVRVYVGIPSVTIYFDSQFDTVA